MGDDPEQLVAVLQSRVRDRLADLRPIRPGAEAYERATDAVIDAAAELIDYEERLPLLLDQAPRRQSLLIVRWSGLVPVAVGASLAVAAVADWLSRWWLLVAIALFLAATVLLTVPVHPPGDRHLLLRPGALLVAVGSLLVAVDATLHLPIWLAGVGVLFSVVGLWHVRRQVRVRAVTLGGAMSGRRDE